MATLQQRADAKLASNRKQRSAHACYPCSKRKIKCDGTQPCEQCRKNNHADICFYQNARRPQARGKRYRQTSGGQTSPGQATPEAESLRDSSRQSTESLIAPLHLDQHSSFGSESGGLDLRPGSGLEEPRGASQKPSARSKTQMGRFSLAALIREKLSPQHPVASDDVRSSLGLMNLHEQDSVSQLFSPSGDNDDLLRQCVKRSEVLEFFQHFHSHVALFYPIVEDNDAFQVLILDKLNDFDKLHSEDGSQLRTSIRKSSAQIALCLSILALGAQFSSLSSSERIRRGQDFAERAQYFLQLSKYMINPCVETVQTLLFIGIYMQNIGQSDGAWSLLGLTFRIAQSLGLCKDNNAGEQALWNIILWQDSLLSLRFDRLPMRSGGALISGLMNSGPGDANTYATSMLRLNHITLSFLSTPREERVQQATVAARVEEIHQVVTNAAPYLQSEKLCKSLRQRLQQLGLRIHSSFLRAEVCRPYLAIFERDDQSEPRWLRGLCIQSMEDVMQAYLDMSKISILPLRSWSLIHEALSCACVLALLQPTQADSRVDNMLGKVQELIDGESASRDSESQPSTGGFIMRGVKLLMFLRRYGHDIAQNATSAPQSTVIDASISIPTASSTQAQAETGTSSTSTTTFFETPVDANDLTFDQSWLEPFFLETGLDSSLSSFLDLSSSYF